MVLRLVRRWVVLSFGLPVLLVAAAVVYVMGISLLPWGTAPSDVREGTDCPVASEFTTVVGPSDRPAEDNELYEPGRDWDLIDDDPESLPGGWLGGTGAERWMKSRLPWNVRFRINWDSEGSALVAIGSHDDICMLARLVASARS